MFKLTKLRNEMKKSLMNDIDNLRKEEEFLEVGTEAYLNNVKAQNVKIEMVNKLDRIDPNQIIGAGITITCFTIYMVLQQTRIIDLRPIQNILNLFRRK